MEMQSEALNDLTKSIEILKSKGSTKNLQYCYFRRGFILKVLKRFNEATNDFEKAKNLDPMNPYLNINYRQLKGVNFVPIDVPGELDYYE